MPGKFGGKELVDPMAFFRECRDRDLPTDWFGLPNSFTVRLGSTGDCGTGHVLLRRRHLDDLSRSTQYELVLEDDQKRRVTLKKITLTSARCLSPGYEDDPDACFLCGVADRRHQEQTNSLTGSVTYPQTYNYVTDVGQEYDPSSDNAGATWTWAEMFAALWAMAFAQGTSSPTAPALPFSPHGKPDRFDYRHNLWKGRAALDHALTRIACALKYHPTNDTFSVVRLGADDAAADDAVDGIRDRLLWSDQPQPGDEAGTAFVACRFRRMDFTTGEGTYSFARYTEIGPTSPAAPSVWQEMVLLRDDFMYRSGSSVAAHAQARTNERVTDYLRVRTRFGKPFVAVYSGIATEALTALGARYDAVAFHDRGHGVRTELAVTGRLLDRLRDWEPVWFDSGPPPVVWHAQSQSFADQSWGAGTAGTRVSALLTVPADVAVYFFFFYEVSVDVAADGLVTVELWETNSGGSKTGGVIHTQTANVLATERRVFNHFGFQFNTFATGLSNTQKYYALFIDSIPAGTTVGNSSGQKQHATNIAVMWYQPRYDLSAAALVSNPVPV